MAGPWRTADVREPRGANSSYSVNTDHGLQRTNEDKKKAVMAALKHPKGVKLSDTKIAGHVGVNDKTVAKYRQQTGISFGSSEGDGAGWSGWEDIQHDQHRQQSGSD